MAAARFVHRRHATPWRAGVLLVWLAATPVSAQENQFLGLAEHLNAPGPYRGPTVALADGQPRPRAPVVALCSERLPLCVGSELAADAARAPAILAALERASDWLFGHGWALPYPDGGHGGTRGFDVYLAEGFEAGARVEPEQLASATPLDAAFGFGVLERSVPDAALDRCALALLAEAGLLARDPAEAAAPRRASAAFATWLALGELGCDDAPEEAQANTHLGVLGDEPARTSSLALWLAFLSVRHDGGSGAQLRGIWEAGAQHSDKPSALHARPSFWRALDGVLQRANESLEAGAEEIARVRYSAPQQLGLARDQRPAPLATRAWSKLPATVYSAEPLATFGSSYVVVDTRGVRAGMQLRVWLRAEPTARWSLAVTALTANGKTLSSITAPPRKVPESYVPIELSDDTDQVIVTITALPLRAFEERPRLDEHAFKVSLAIEGAAQP